MSPLSCRTNSIGYGASMIVGMPFGTQFAVGLSVLRSNAASCARAAGVSGYALMSTVASVTSGNSRAIVRVWLQTRKMPSSGREPSPSRAISNDSSPTALARSVQRGFSPTFRSSSRPSGSSTCRAYISLLSPSGGFAAIRMRSPTRIVPSLDPHALQHRQRARLDLPDDAVGAHAEVRVRIAPQHFRDLARRARRASACRTGRRSCDARPQRRAAPRR